MTKSDMLFALIGSAICGTRIDGLQIRSGELEELIALAERHDVAHLLARGLENCSIKSAEAEKALFKAVYRYEQINYEYESLCAVLEKEQIPYMPLKGAVIRLLYPEEWMRTSCDIDVLVKECDLKRAAHALLKTGAWETDGKREYHDMSLYSKGGVHLELHFSIKENTDNIDGLLSEVWDHSVNEGGQRFLQTNEFFVFHHIAHMSYHFISGGCGIKPFVDLYVIKNKLKYDGTVVREYCKDCGLEKFYDNVLYVTDVWFGGAVHTDISRRTEEYILRGGVYGSLENSVALAHTKKGGKAKYILSRIFFSYDSLKNQYPVLNKHRWLFPFMQVARWFRFLFKGDFKRSLKEIKINNSVSSADAAGIREFLSDIGLGG